MYPPSPNTPSTRRANRNPVPPDAPYIGTLSLPATPNPYGGMPLPVTPHMAYATLPPMTHVHYGLATPPPTPRGPARAVGPELHPDLAGALVMDMRNPLPALPTLDQPASAAPLTVLLVRNALCTFEVRVANPHGLTVRDVLSTIHANLHARSPTGHGTVLNTAFGPNVVFSGLAMTGPGVANINMVPSTRR